MVCSVSLCPAEALPGRTTCAIHEHARTAKELRLGPDSAGRGAVRCGKCRRAFKDDEFVERASHVVKKRGGWATKWLHVYCSPTVSRPSKKTIRESDKPLLTASAE
jgi:hypothetical protein